MSHAPEGVSTMLYTRLWSNHGAYLTLWKAGHRLEADIILRSAVEAAICLAANKVLGKAFYPLILADLATTLKTRASQFRSAGSTRLAQEAEELRQRLMPRTEGKRGYLNWSVLAEASGHPELYDLHQHLSSSAAHVAAYSMMRGVTGEDGTLAAQHAELAVIEGARHPVFMANATLLGATMHAEVAGAAEFLARSQTLISRSNQVTSNW